ncbi:MAG: hypothetical protein ACTHZW_07070 [Microbacteriaceae bacterium]|uniref:hypothetical protein n=1 Tax=Microbacterium sp. TaxID=51671 RepID=UPI003F9CDE06
MTISIVVEGVAGALGKILREMQEFPAAVEVAVSEGGTSTVTKPFRDEVTYAAREMSFVTTKIVDVVNDTQDHIRAAVKTLMETDAEFADEGRRLLALLESAGEQSEGSGGTY